MNVSIPTVAVNAVSASAGASPANPSSLAPFANLGLSEQQRTQIRSILQSGKQTGASPTQLQQQIDAVLTPAQRQAAAADGAGKAGHHGHHHHRSGASSGTAASAPASSPPLQPDATNDASAS